MKRGVIAAVIVLVLIAIVVFSIRGRGGNGEKVYAEPATPRKIEAVVTAPGEIDPKFKVNI